MGHTHEDIDQLFSVLSRYIRNLGKILDPVQFLEELRNAMSGRHLKLEPVYSVFDWISYLRPSLVHPIPSGIQHSHLGEEVLSPHTFWIHRRQSDGRVVMHYKEFAADEVWLPPMDPNADALVTNPEGMEIFKRDCPPPDPAQQVPSVAALNVA